MGYIEKNLVPGETVLLQDSAALDCADLAAHRGPFQRRDATPFQDR